MSYLAMLLFFLIVYVHVGADFMHTVVQEFVHDASAAYLLPKAAAAWVGLVVWVASCRRPQNLMGSLER